MKIGAEVEFDDLYEVLIANESEDIRSELVYAIAYFLM